MRLGYYLTFADKILIGGLILLSLASYPFVRYMTTPGEDVQIEVDGGWYKTLPLHQEQQIAVQGPLGVTTVIIQNGRVHIADSPCRTKICVQTGEVSLNGQLIVCAPNKIVVRVNGAQEPEYDAITR